MKYILISYIAVSVAIAADVDVFAKEDLVTRLGLGSGWTPLAYFNVRLGSDCPTPLLNVTENGKTMCRRASDNSGCTSITYPSNGILYNKTLGLVRGYQKGTTDSFHSSKYLLYGINDPYVDGVSITIGNPRKHVWTYASGFSSDLSYAAYNCPCSVIPGPEAPSFVREDYYCSSGCSTTPVGATYYTDNSLWQGTGCTNAKDNCCADVGLPWFYREFPFPQDDDFEVRICYNQVYADEAVLIDALALFVQEV